MVFAALVFMCSFPQNGDTQKIFADKPAIVAENSLAKSSLTTTDGLAAQPNVPAAPEAKVKMDTELAAEPRPARPALQPGTPLRPASTHYSETHAQRKIWYGLAAAGHTAAVLDAWSTRRVLSGNYGTEQNPLLRPFAHSGVLYAATQVSPLVMDYFGKRMMTSRHPILRKMWWLPQSAGAGFSAAAAAHNAGIAH